MDPTRRSTALVTLTMLAGLLLVVLAPDAALAQSQGQRVPQIRIEPPLRDFGLVQPSTTHPTTFTLRNVGPEPLTVAAAIPSCKCTSIEGLAGATIAPGASVNFSAEMVAPSTPGEKKAKVMIAFAGYKGAAVANLRCEVVLPVVVDEEFVDALKGTTSGRVTIRSRDGKPFRLLSSNGDAPAFVGFDPSSDSPRSSYDVAWSVAGWPCEGMRLWWIFETDHPECPIVPARIRHECTGSKADPGRFQRHWIFDEQIVNAGAVQAGTPTTIKIAVRNNQPTSGARKPATRSTAYREITSVRSLSPDLTATLVKVTPKAGEEAEVQISVTVRPGFEGMLYAPVMVTGPTGEHPVALVASVRPGRGGA